MKTFVILLVAAATVTRPHAAPFQNLGFDQPNSFDDWGVGTTQDVLPGWSLYHGNTPQTEVGFNRTYIFMDDLTNVALFDSEHAPLRVEGFYGLNLTARTGDSFSLAQRGDIPEDRPFLKIRKISDWSLTVNGEPVQSALDTGNNFFPVSTSVKVFDLSQFAGQNAELRFTTRSASFFPPYDDYWLDSVEFLQEVPEPELVTLFFFGLATLLIGGRQANKVGARAERNMG